MIAIVSLILGMLSSISSFTENADALFSARVAEGRVDYKAIKQDRNRMDSLYRQIGAISLEDASEAEKKAFYINAYNIITIYQVVKHYPVKSPQDIAGFFDQQKHTVAGELLTLNELEKEKLLTPYQDPRVHFVLVCAAASCPPLADFAYRADQLDKQLDQKTRQALNDDQFIRVMKDRKKVELSKIFEWYQDDFLKKAASPLAYINQYRDEKISTSYDVGYYEYDWTLNQQ